MLMYVEFKMDISQCGFNSDQILIRSIIFRSIFSVTQCVYLYMYV